MSHHHTRNNDKPSNEFARHYRHLGLVAAVFLLALALSCRRHPQQEGRSYGGANDDYGNDVQPTADGGFVVVGSTGSFGAGKQDVYVVRTDAAGETLWTSTYGGTSNDFGVAVQLTSDGGCIVAGSTSSAGAGESDVLLVKFDAAGGVTWSRTYGGPDDDKGYAVLQTTDGGYVITGSSGPAGSGDVYLVRTDTAGYKLWTRFYGGITDDCGNDIQPTSDGGYVVVGTISHSFYLIKTDADGETLWTRAYGQADNNWGFSVRPTLDGGYIVVGTAGDEQSTDLNLCIIKTDSAGGMFWTRTYGETDGRAVLQTPDGGYVIAGTGSDFGTGRTDVRLLRTDAAGETLWTRTYGGREFEYGNAIQPTADGGFIIAGTTESYGAGARDIFLVKTDSRGDAELVR